MESRAPALKQTHRVLARRRLWTNFAKTALGVTLLAALVFWGRIDLNVLLELAAAPWDVPRALVPDAPPRRPSLGHFSASTGRVDSLCQPIPFRCHRTPHQRALAGQRRWRRSSGTLRLAGAGPQRRARRRVGSRRPAVSLFAVLFISLAFSLFYWRQMQHVPALAALGTSIVVAAV